MTGQEPDGKSVDEELGRASVSALDVLNTLVDVEQHLWELCRRVGVGPENREDT